MAGTTKNDKFRSEYSKGSVSLVYFALVAPCVSRRRGAPAERIPGIPVSPNTGEFFALPGPLCPGDPLFSFRAAFSADSRARHARNRRGNSVASRKISLEEIDAKGELRDSNSSFRVMRGCFPASRKSALWRSERLWIFFFLDVKVPFCFPFLPCNSFFGLLLSRVSIRDTVRTRYFENYGFLFFFLLCISSFSHLFVPRKTFLRRRSNCKSNFPINETTIFQRCFRCLISSSDNLILNWTAEKRIVEGG